MGLARRRSIMLWPDSAAAKACVRAVPRAKWATPVPVRIQSILPRR